MSDESPYDPVAMRRVLQQSTVRRDAEVVAALRAEIARLTAEITRTSSEQWESLHAQLAEASKEVARLTAENEQLRLSTTANRNGMVDIQPGESLVDALMRHHDENAALRAEVARLTAERDALAAWACAECGARFDSPAPLPALDGVTLCSSCAERNVLRARRAADTALLREVEWGKGEAVQVGNIIKYAAYCPVCGGMKPKHAPDCRLAARLEEKP